MFWRCLLFSTWCISHCAISKHGTSLMSICIGCYILLEVLPDNSFQKFGFAEFWFIEIFSHVICSYETQKKYHAQWILKTLVSVMTCLYVSLLIDILTMHFEKLIAWPWNLTTSQDGRLYTSILMDTEPVKQLFIQRNRNFWVVVWLLILLPSTDGSLNYFSIQQAFCFLFHWTLFIIIIIYFNWVFTRCQ
jgi:hypothetical protein